MAPERITRGRLSSLDLLPEEAQDDLIWALGELNARKRTQADILSELNGRLADKGLDLISKSAFNRKAVRIAAVMSRREESAAVYAAVAKNLTPQSVDEASIVVGELIKMAIAATLEGDAGGLSSEDLANLASGYRATVAAMKLSADHKRAQLAEFNAKVGEAVEAVSKAKGITADTRRALMEQLGVIQKGA